MVHAYDIRTQVPSNIKLSWSLKNITQCPGCSKPIVTPMRLRPCNHVVCSSCSAAANANPQCAKCRQEVTGTDLDEEGLARVKGQATATCENCNWRGGFEAARTHFCQQNSAASLFGADAAPEQKVQPAAAPRHHPLEMEGSFVTHIFWDYDNIKPPADETIQFYIGMVKKLEAESFVFSRYFISATAYIRSGGNYEDLALAAAKMRIDVHVAETKQEAADRLISNDIRELLTSIERERRDNGGFRVQHKVVIVSSDNDFIDDIKFCEEAEVATCVLHKAETRAARVLSFHASKALHIDECFKQEAAVEEEEEESDEEEEVEEPVPPPPKQPTPTKAATAKPGKKAAAQQEVKEKEPQPVPTKVLKRTVVSYVEDDHLTVDGTSYHVTELVRNAGFSAAQDGSAAPVLCEIRGTHNITQCRKIHPLAKLRAATKAPAAAPAAKAWGTAAANPAVAPSKPATAPPTAAPAATPAPAATGPIKVVAGMKNPDRIYHVEGEPVPESKLIRNNAVDYLDHNPHAKGKKCTNRNPHDAKDCTYIHFKKVRK